MAEISHRSTSILSRVYTAGPANGKGGLSRLFVADEKLIDAPPNPFAMPSKGGSGRASSLAMRVASDQGH
ncbi:MAG: hypothetical protein GEV11_09590 [Streptosporangiales bacterium]|nr:hypothetical protein [Streptosporangiales bacterium]